MRFWNLFAPITLLPIAAADFLVTKVQWAPLGGTGGLPVGVAFNASTTNNCTAAAALAKHSKTQYNEKYMQLPVCDLVVEIRGTSWKEVPDQEFENGTCSQIQGYEQCTPDDWSTQVTMFYELFCPSALCVTGWLD
ncbi:uncharacterized protein EI90DRAFT_3093710 [Cantharellus anzutake]|uniref:uncharacterized protein n=1 Tax=Cantharellus anzutake TaxID=1750568 RepID=UPI001904D8BE|nr:uncharacterized protein EI90DRAFT_3093710 [Cantharellus anzutake]KAF8312419.1 hypothetical protein EI90DRAFT_3093710 [Cantharellus anzutake]